MGRNVECTVSQQMDSNCLRSSVVLPRAQILQAPEGDRTMTGLLSSTSGKLNTLILLLLWFNAQADKCPRSYELDVDMENLLAKHSSLQKCPGNCTIIEPRDSRCKCLNISFSNEKVFPTYFIEGLKLLDSTDRTLLRRLNHMASNSACMEKLNKIFVDMTFETWTPPRLFLLKLESMWQQLNMIVATSSFSVPKISLLPPTGPKLSSQAFDWS
ncbi:uncharacterized protein ACB058_012265 [Synchiropus picturatus]